MFSFGCWFFVVLVGFVRLHYNAGGFAWVCGRFVFLLFAIVGCYGVIDCAMVECWWLLWLRCWFWVVFD